MEVVAPHEAGIPRFERVDSLTIRRFRYLFPVSLQRVAYRGGIPTNLRGSWAARLQVPLFLISFLWVAAMACRRADVVHAHWTISGLVGLLATRIWRRPVALSVRGSDAKLGGRLSRWVSGKVWRAVGANLTVSDDIGQLLLGEGVPDERVRVIPNGISGRFRPASRDEARVQLGLPPTGYIVLYVGLLVPVKGVDVLLQSFTDARRPEWMCVVVGDGPLRADLETVAAEAGVGDSFRFVGRQPSGEMPTWLNAADVLVLPSHSEGRPNVVMEAQACGLPVIATRVGGTPELITDGVTGILIEPGDVDGLAGALRRMALDPELRVQIGARARGFIESSELTWEASSAAVESVYGQLLEGANP